MAILLSFPDSYLKIHLVAKSVTFSSENEDLKNGWKLNEHSNLSPLKQSERQWLQLRAPFICFPPQQTSRHYRQRQTFMVLDYSGWVDGAAAWVTSGWTGLFFFVNERDVMKSQRYAHIVEIETFFTGGIKLWPCHNKKWRSMLQVWEIYLENHLYPSKVCWK